MTPLGKTANDRSLRLWLGFIAAQTIHFAVVVWFAVMASGANLFPGGRSLQDVGGWPTVFAIFAFNYALAFVALAERRAGVAASRRLRLADLLSTAMMGFHFLATYVPLLFTSLVFAMPVLILTTALGLFLVREIRQPQS